MSDKKVFIIGNGFDLSMGWPTSYSSYAADMVCWPFGGDSTSGLAMHMSGKANMKKWLDIEHELYLYASPENNVSFNGNAHEDHVDFIRLKNGLTQYLLAIQKEFPISDKTIAAQVLSHIVRNGKFEEIYTFNYTNLQYIANSLGLGKINFHYVHGSLENADIVLGVDDHNHLFDGYDFLYKTFDKNYPSTPIQYALQEANEVVFFGHSLGETDYHYFQNFFQRQSEMTMSMKDQKKITIFTYDDSSRMEILRQLRNMNNQKSLALLFANNDFQIICTNGKDPKDKVKMDDFFKHLNECSVEADEKALESISSIL